jgi:hypothetical protein
VAHRKQGADSTRVAIPCGWRIPPMFKPSGTVSGPACGGRRTLRARPGTASPAAIVMGAAASAPSSWVIQTSQTTERLRGVSAASDAAAWSSGQTRELRTVDSGATWARRSVPGAEELDFRDVGVGADTACVPPSVGRQVAHLQDGRRRQDLGSSS